MDEQSVKIGYIYNFLAKSVFWPRKISPTHTGAGNIHIIGDIQLNRCLKTNIQSKPNSSMRVNLEYSPGGENIPDCHILFIGKGAADAIPSCV